LPKYLCNGCDYGMMSPAINYLSLERDPQRGIPVLRPAAP
jgi:hypothetical protein